MKGVGAQVEFDAHCLPVHFGLLELANIVNIANIVVWNPNGANPNGAMHMYSSIGTVVCIIVLPVMIYSCSSIVFLRRKRGGRM